MSDDPAQPVNETLSEDATGTEFPDPDLARQGTEGFGRSRNPLIPNNGRLHVLPQAISERLHLPKEVEVVDPRFRRYSHSYLLQAFLAAVTILVILLFVDSLADAALAAGLGSSVVILFVHPSTPAAKPRSLVGGHTLALMVGVAFSFLIFNSPASDIIVDSRIFSDMSLAVSVGVVILVMALTNTQHPPAAATVLGISMHVLDPLRMAVFIASIILLALIHFFLKSHLNDLI